MTENIEGFLVKKSFRELQVWDGVPINDTYGNKPILNYKGKPLFAELFALKLYNEKGYNGVWVDTFKRKFRTELPENKESTILLPEFIQEKLNTINPSGKMSGTWDLILWKGNKIEFVELKRKGKDKIRNTQIEFLKRALNAEIEIDNFEIFEWSEVNS